MTRLATVLAIVFLAGCTSSTTDAPVPSLVGGWAYRGQRTTGASGVTTYTGRLEFRRQEGMAFDGNFSAEVRDAQGVVTLETGFLAGAFVTAGAVDFDVTVGDEVLRHVGRVQHDSIVGSWVSSNNTQGSFAAVRDRP